MKKLYVGNLPYDVTDDELSQLFTQCGQVTSARVVMDRNSGRSKGFGFVEMAHDDEAESAMSRIGGQDFHGRQLLVNEARERASGGGGGGYRSNRDGGGGFRDDDY